MRAREEGTRARRTSFLSHRARYPPSWIAPPFSILAPKNISCPCHGLGVESGWATRASNTREYSFEQRTYRSWKTRERGKAMAAQREKGNSLRWSGNQTPVSNVCKVAPRSLFWASRRTQRITGSAFRISFQPDWLIDNAIFNRPIMARTQILVLRWRPKTRILVLFRRRTYPEFSFVSSAG